MENTVTILRTCPFFANLGPEAWQQIVNLARLVRFPAGETIFFEGVPCPGMYVVGSGLVRIFKLSPAGKEHVLHMATPGKTFAEVAAIGNFACPANAEALEDTVCVLLPQAEFLAALRESHSLCLELMGSMALWVRQLVHLMEDITLRDAAGRVARYLQELAETQGETLALPSTKRHLASHLNLTSETLSRTLRRLHDAGVLNSCESDLTIIDHAALARLAHGENGL